MEQLLTKLVSAARSSQEVISSKVEGDLQLLAYPHEQSVLVALGYQAVAMQRVQLAAVLRLRGANLERYGAWLPAMFSDGSWYLVRRVLEVAETGPVLSEQELVVAREMLA